MPVSELVGDTLAHVRPSQASHPTDPWAPGVRAVDVPVVPGGEPSPFADLGDSKWRLKDLLGDATYDWNGNDLQGRGLYLDERPWSARVFALRRG